MPAGIRFRSAAPGASRHAISLSEPLRFFPDHETGPTLCFSAISPQATSRLRPNCHEGRTMPARICE